MSWITAFHPPSNDTESDEDFEDEFDELDGDFEETLFNKMFDGAAPDIVDSPLHGDLALSIRRASPKVGRNEPRPCGSGKKYKKCCGVN